MPPAYKIIVVFVLLVNVVPLLQPLRKLVERGGKRDDVVVSEEKLRPIRNLLPPHEVIGYITAGEVTKENLVELEACRIFYMTQYALAPNILMHEITRRYVVGNFKTHEEALATARQQRMTILKDFGNGLLLLQGKQTP